MIEGKVIKFGYGDVVTRSNQMGYIEFVNIKPPLECGTPITPEMDLEYGGVVVITEDKPFELYELAKQITRENCVIDYKGYTLDFVRYNEKSVNTLINAAYNMVNPLILAC